VVIRCQRMGGPFIMDCYHHYNTIPEQSARGECTTSAVLPHFWRGRNTRSIWGCRLCRQQGMDSAFWSFDWCTVFKKNEVSWGPSSIRLWILPSRHPGNSVGRYL